MAIRKAKRRQSRIRRAPLRLRRASSRRKGKRSSPRRRVRKPLSANRRVVHYWSSKAYAAGCQAAVNSRLYESDSLEPEDRHKRVNSSWNKWYRANSRLPWRSYSIAAHRFKAGYDHHAGGNSGNQLLIPTDRTVAAIVTVMNEGDTISSLLEQLHRLPLHEIIFIVNGSTDDSFEKIRNESQAIIVYYPQALGHDVGRAIGASLAESEILLFLDGDFVLNADQLLPFIHSIEQGMDIALNNISPYLSLFSSRDEVTIVKEFVNRAMGRSDLGASSLTAVPHAMSKQAAQIIGYHHLSIPPKAQVIALHKGLRVASPASVDVFSRNRIRTSNIGRHNPVAELIIGDHIEALKIILEQRGPRLFYPDDARQRRLS